MTLKDHLETLAEEYTLVLHTDAGRLFSTVRRMKAERKMGIPIFLRTGFAISTKNGKAASAMTEDEWEEFYNALSKRLRVDYPELYESLFSPNKTGKGILDAAELTGPRAVEIANEYARNHSSALSQPSATLGGWTNKAESRIYLDVSQNINDRQAAVDAGKARNQVAIWDVKSAEIPTGALGNEKAIVTKKIKCLCRQASRL